jgi:UDP-hydrolysing UDP-N-acetyl-D-glucosamine 2-epimerase
MHKRRICVVTGSRAEYGLLSVLMRALKSEPAFTLQIVATGMHLAPQFGLTWREIEADGFIIDARVDMQLTSDTPAGVTKSLGLAVIGFAETFNRLKPDLLVVLGDRYEILAAAQAALIAKVPVAHIAGGDTTEGAFDEAIRHSITKMSHLHFVTNEVSAKRVRQLGENPEHVFVVGSPGIDVINKVKLLTREELERQLGFRFLKRNLLVTFHPATLEAIPAQDQFQELLKALDALGNDTGIIITLPNADTDSGVIIKLIEHYVSTRPWSRAYPSLGQIRYLSAVSHVDAVVGNSSSGLYEVPSFKKPTVNIGDRQKGRIQASSVINCRPDAADIIRALNESFKKDCSTAVNPYGSGNSAEKIISIMKAVPDYRALLQKHFYEITT